MENQFVGYNEAKQLSELGFSEECFAGYLKKEKTLWIGYVSSQGGEQFNREYHILAPTFSQAFKFFREKHGYYVDLFVDDDKTFGFMISYFVEIGRTDKPIQRKYNTYEEAELECLKKLIEITKEKK